MGRKRALGWDNLRGILILLVVLGHLLEYSGSFPGAGFLYRTIYTCHMPAFLFLTGYFARFDRRKIIRGWVIPYVLFQTAYLLFDRWLYGTETALQYTTPYWILWYLVASTLYHLLLPMYDVASRRQQLLALGITFCLSLAAGFDATVGYPLSLSRFLVFQPWFLLGHYCRRGAWIPKIEAWCVRRKIPVKILLTGLVGVGVVAVQWLAIRPEVLYGSYSYAQLQYGPGQRLIAGITALCWIGFGCLVLLPLLRERVPLLTALGQNTLPVYLLHGFAVRYIGDRYPELLSAPWQVLLMTALILAALGNPLMGGVFRRLFSGKKN